MQLYEAAFGPCGHCGDLVEEKSEYWCGREMKMKPGSVYWTPMPEHVWNKLRVIPEVIALFPPDMVQNVYFLPEHQTPFCGPECVQGYWRDKAAEHCKRGG